MFQPFNIKCDICGRGKFKSQSGLTRHRDTCQQKRREQNQYREQSSEEYAVINTTQFAELSENGDHDDQPTPGRDASSEPMLFDGEAAARCREQSVATSRHTVAKTVSYSQATKREAGTKLALEEVERELPVINTKGSWIQSQ